MENQTDFAESNPTSTMAETAPNNIPAVREPGMTPKPKRIRHTLFFGDEMTEWDKPTPSTKALQEIEEMSLRRREWNDPSKRDPRFLRAIDIMVRNEPVSDPVAEAIRRADVDVNWDKVKSVALKTAMDALMKIIFTEGVYVDPMKKTLRHFSAQEICEQIENEARAAKASAPAPTNTEPPPLSEVEQVILKMAEASHQANINQCINTCRSTVDNILNTLRSEMMESIKKILPEEVTEPIFAQSDVDEYPKSELIDQFFPDNMLEDESHLKTGSVEEIVKSNEPEEEEDEFEEADKELGVVFTVGNKAINNTVGK